MLWIESINSLNDFRILYSSKLLGTNVPSCLTVKKEKKKKEKEKELTFSWGIIFSYPCSYQSIWYLQKITTNYVVSVINFLPLFRMNIPCYLQKVIQHLKFKRKVLPAILHKSLTIANGIYYRQIRLLMSNLASS